MHLDNLYDEKKHIYVKPESILHERAKYKKNYRLKYKKIYFSIFLLALFVTLVIFLNKEVVYENYKIFISSQSVTIDYKIGAIWILDFIDKDFFIYLKMLFLPLLILYCFLFLVIVYALYLNKANSNGIFFNIVSVIFVPVLLTLILALLSIVLLAAIVSILFV